MKNLMGKKTLWVLIVVFFAGHLLTAGLVDLYKKGVIKLVNSPGYGKDTDWESLLYRKVTSIAASEDDSIFLAIPREHNVLMFNPAGQFVKTIGRRGQGPGDLDYPMDLSILDGKYLIVRENPVNRQFSLFDLQGKYIKKVKTSRYVNKPVSLSSGKIAYTYKEDIYYHGVNPKINICILDLESGEEKIVDTISVVERNKVEVSSISSRGGKTHTVGGFHFVNYIGDIYIAQAKGGNLLVGLSSQPDIKIYSPQGKLIRSFRLKMTPVPVTPELIQKTKKANIKSARKRERAKTIEAISFDRMFEKHLPYYQNIRVDSSGNILTFKWLECDEDCAPVFQVYSPKGEYVCETRIEEGIYDVKDGRRMAFTEKGIYGIFQLKESDDISLRLIKVSVPAK